MTAPYPNPEPGEPRPRLSERFSRWTSRRQPQDEKPGEPNLTVSSGPSVRCFSIRNAMVWCLGLAIGLLFTWWLFYIPYQPATLYAAIPAHADFISTHDRLAARWSEFAGNPLAVSLFSALGMVPEDIQALDQDPESRAWLGKLAGRRTIFAHVPSMSVEGRPAWVATSWLGGRSQIMRWQLNGGLAPDFKKVDTYRGHTIWLVRAPALGKGQRLAVCLVEGMVIAFLSDRPGHIRKILDTYDGFLPSIQEQEVARKTADAQDWGMAQVDLPVQGHVASHHLTFDIRQISSNSLNAILTVDYPQRELAALTNAPELDGIDRLLGPLPFTGFYVGKQALLDFCKAPTALPWQKLLSTLLAKSPGNTVLLSGLGGDYSGRFFGLKLPSCMVAMRANPDTATHEDVNHMVDRLNAMYQWGLILRTTTLQEHKITALESTQNNVLGKLTVDELPAYTLCGDWLVFSSNLAALQKLVTRYEKMESLDEARHCAWVTALGGRNDPVGLWLDLENGAKTIRLALSTWSLKLLMEDPIRSADQRARITNIKDWVDALAPLQQCRIWATSDAVQTVITLNMGK